MILCLDTSGSMSLYKREYIAKSITYYLSYNAIKQNRCCLVINFSDDIITFEVNKEPKKLANFLSLSFGSGTRVAFALEEALKILKRKKYNTADVLLISDFDFNYIDENLVRDIVKQVKKGQSLML